MDVNVMMDISKMDLKFVKIVIINVNYVKQVLEIVLNVLVIIEMLITNVNVWMVITKIIQSNAFSVTINVVLATME